MAASTLADDCVPAASTDRLSARRLVGWVASSLVAALWLVALILLARRSAGSFTKTLAAPSLLAVGLISALAAVADRVALRSTPPLRSISVWRWALPGLGALLLAGVVTLPGVSLADCLLLWWAPAAFEVVAWWWFRTNGRVRAMAAVTPSIAVGPAELGEEGPPPPEVSQHLTRSRSDDGRELLSGWLRIDFAPHQRTASAHVAFCPPFTATPMVEVAPIEGPEAEVEVGEVHAFGARFDLKLRQASSAASRVGIEVSVWQASRSS